ncbi:MAG: flagellar hook protein FlgE [Asticcacaulis sp.]
MSLNASMQAGVSGLAANATALSAISNNIANVNTTAYKRVRTDFSAIVTSATQQRSYNAGGVNAATRHVISNISGLSRTNSDLDLGIDGQGFFVTTQSPGATANDLHLFTRDGSFTTDENGFLKNAAGLYLQGWPVNELGAVNTSSSDFNQLAPIKISDIGGTAEASSAARLSANLNAAQAVSTGGAAYAAAVTATPPTAPLPMSKYNINTPNTLATTKPDVEITIPVADSLGGERNLTMSLVKIGANQWAYEIWSPDIVNGSGTPAGAAWGSDTTSGNGQVASGILMFDENTAKLDPANSTMVVGGTTYTGATFGNAELDIGAWDATTGVRWGSDTGVAGQDIHIDFNSLGTGFTQYNASSVTHKVTSNGTAFGILDEITISETGMVTAIFTNGSTRDIAQVALATFVNADGLVPVSGNAYRVSTTSGPYVLKVPGDSGSGLLSVATLEASAVDLSQEFTGLITTQRAYSASSKIITTADEMLQELLNIKR